MITEEFNFLSIRFEYSSGDLIYRGVNVIHNEDTAAKTWYIFKYTWGTDGIEKIEGPLVGSWDDRSLLAWG